MSFKNRSFLFLAILLSTGSFSHVDAQSLPLDPMVRTGKLPNGFTYYIRKNKLPEHRVTMYLATKAGSILETDAQQGLAHFTEHMSFNGTTHFPKNELVDYLQKSGVRFGADINANTSFDETVYQLPLPSDNPELLKNGLQIMRDWAQEATFDTTEINQERGVIMEEKRLRKGASGRIQEKTLPVMLNHSRYASRLPIGTEDVLLHFKPETIRSFYKDWYRPDLQALIVVGDIDPVQMEQSIKDKFSDLRNPANEKQRTKYTIPLTGKSQFLQVTDKEVTNTSLQVMFKHNTNTIKTAADYRAALVKGLFADMLGGRYAELSRQADPPFLSGGAGIEQVMGDIDAFTISATTKSGALEKGYKAAYREVRRVQQTGFTASELERAKKNYTSSLDAALKEKDKTPSESYVNEYLQYFLLGAAAPGITKEYALVNSLLPGITLQETDSVLNAYLRNNNNRDIIVLAPQADSASLPDEATILGWMKTVDEEIPTAYKDDINNMPLLKKAPVAGKIIKEEKEIKLGLTTFTLSNGMKVVLKKTNFQGNQILFNGFSAGGTSLYSDADYQSAANAASLMGSGGIGNYDAIQLGKFLSGKQVSLSPFISERSQGFSGSAAPQDLGLALELLYGCFTEPRKDTIIFKAQISKAKASLANAGNDPNQVFSDTVKAVMSSNNPRFTGPSIAKLDQIDLERAAEIYKERFADASGFTFIFVGNIDEKKIKPLLEKYLASLPATHAHEAAKDLGVHIPPGKISKTVYKGSEQKATVYMVYSGPFEYTYENSLKMAAIKEALEIRLIERLREMESGVYTPSADINIAKLPVGRFSLTISFGCAPENVEKLVASAQDEVNQLIANGPSAVNVEKFKAEDNVSRQTILKNNEFWLGYLGSQYVNKEPLEQVFDYDKAMSTVTPQSLKATAAKFITNDNYIRLVLMPEKQ